MRRARLGVLSAAALSAAAVLAGGAAAVHSPTAYDAMLLPTPGSTVIGAAALVDLPANDTLTVGLQGLMPGAAYEFHVHETDAPGDPCLTPPAAPHQPHEGWIGTALTADPGGLATGLATAPSFTLHHDEETYWVDVETPEGAVVACGVLKPRPL